MTKEKPAVPTEVYVCRQSQSHKQKVCASGGLGLRSWARGHAGVSIERNTRCGLRPGRLRCGCRTGPELQRPGRELKTRGGMEARGGGERGRSVCLPGRATQAFGQSRQRTIPRRKKNTRSETRMAASRLEEYVPALGKVWLARSGEASVEGLIGSFCFLFCLFIYLFFFCLLSLFSPPRPFSRPPRVDDICPQILPRASAKPCPPHQSMPCFFFIIFPSRKLHLALILSDTSTQQTSCQSKESRPSELATFDCRLSSGSRVESSPPPCEGFSGMTTIKRKRGNPIMFGKSLCSSNSSGTAPLGWLAVSGLTFVFSFLPFLPSSYFGGASQQTQNRPCARTDVLQTQTCYQALPLPEEMVSWPWRLWKPHSNTKKKKKSSGFLFW